MSTPYGISTSRGSVSYNSYVNTPITGPLNTNQYPGIIPYHRYGMLTGLRPTPPLFYPSQEPVNADQNTNSRHQYFRTAESSESLAINREPLFLREVVYIRFPREKEPLLQVMRIIFPQRILLCISKKDVPWRLEKAPTRLGYHMRLPFPLKIITQVEPEVL